MRQLIRIATLLVLCLAGVAAWAQRVEGEVARAEGMYQAEVPVRNQDEAERRAGFARALVEVLTRLSGDRGVAARPGVAQELRRAEELVEGYDYRQDEGVSPSGAPTFRTLLVVRFDPAEVDAVAALVGLPVWPEPRPKPVLWLAIDDGRGPRLVALQQRNAARAILDRAVERGYRLGLPAGSAAEQAAVGAIWRGDAAAIARLSARYSPPMQLIGKLYRAPGGGWAAEWQFVDQGKVLARWNSSDADARRAMAAGADGAADALIKRYAKPGVPPKLAAPGRYTVRIQGVDDAEDYLRLAAWLQGQAVVRGIVPREAGADGLLLELDLATGVQGLRRAAARDEVLVPAEGEAEPALFFMR